mgnify:CR=1 FL=1
MLVIISFSQVLPFDSAPDLSPPWKIHTMYRMNVDFVLVPDLVGIPCKSQPHLYPSCSRFPAHEMATDLITKFSVAVLSFFFTRSNEALKANLLAHPDEALNFRQKHPQKIFACGGLKTPKKNSPAAS